MAYDFGFDFRATQAYVTDPSYATYELCAGGGGGTSYPTTRSVNGVSITFGWEQAVQTRNRSSGIDPRLAGINFQGNSGSTYNFRVDLPASGLWSIGLGCGDAAAGNAQKNYIIIKDTTTQVLDCSVNTSSTQVGDAAKNLWSTAAWPGSNVLVPVTFSTTILRVQICGTVATDSSCLMTLRLIQSSSLSQLATLGAG